MLALGLRLEENGTVLALREEGHEAGRRWERVPESVLRKLDAGKKVLPGAQERGPVQA